MDSLQRSVKQTDGMLRAVVQQLSKQIATMGTSNSNSKLARTAKKLEASLAQVQRVHGHLEYDLGKLAAIIEGSAAKESDIEQSTDEESADEESSEDESVNEKDKALSRMETKLDSLTTQVAELEPLALRSESKIDDVLSVCKTADNSQTLSVTRLVAIEHSLSEIKKGNGGGTYPGAVATNSGSLPVVEPARPVPPRVDQPKPKKRKISFIVSNPDPAQSHEGQLRQLSDDQKKNLRNFTKLRSLTEGILDRLVPCPDGRFWDADLIFEHFRSLWDTQRLSLQVAQLTEYMDAKKSRLWLCVRRMATNSPTSPASDGECGTCKVWCVQLTPVEADSKSKDNRYYARVVRSRRDSLPVIRAMSPLL
ncbi:uncharacterized protein B0H64DRAFT_374822 [Chaetomium fimeti]|uniref:Uncharacterized protein n=1 Tax=Chaetomium fimeti TaxID=1854472 RepID=A0AAE0HCF3_9PEZI|nr:hypothetical protein B0H64DRAFT_374822 [Chaetomium fimeti]